MFQPLLNLRLLILDSCNELADEERDATARAWVDILELEAARLIDSDVDWAPIVAEAMDCDADTVTAAARRARRLGLMEGRLALILADQLVAALIRGHLTGVET